MINILVLEDDEGLAALLQILLKKLGCQVNVAGNGLEGIAYLTAASNVPDLILCDIFMPHMNGFLFIEHLKRQPHWSQIPIIVMTSAPADFYRDLSLTYGANAFLPKPFSYQRLTAMLQDMGIPPGRTH